MKKVALVIGHRLHSQGAYGSEGVSEYMFYKDLVSELLPLLPNNVEVCVFERSDSIKHYTQKMKELHNRIDKFGADVSISLHFNASSNRRANGHEVLYCSDKGKKLANIMNSIFNDNLSNSNRGTKKRKKSERGGGFLCRGKSTCILIEPFFASNQSDYLRGEGRQQLINSLVSFIETISK